jgi:hypothetical protein
MWLPNFHELVTRLAHVGEFLPAIMVTVGISLLVICALSCASSPCEEKDDLFHREVF